MKVNEFRELSRVDEIGVFTLKDKDIEYKKYLSYSEKINIVYSALENSFNAEENVYDRIGLDTTLKYMILTRYITNINFPKHKVGDEMLADVEQIIDIGFSSGMYNILIDCIKDDYEHIMELLEGKIKESNETKHFTNMLGKIMSEIKDLDEGKLEKMVEKVSGLEAFRKMK